MKYRFFKIGISSLIFFLMICTAVLLVRPLYYSLYSKIQSYKQKAFSVLENELGLAVTYKSLSPSILTGFSLSGIEVYDQNIFYNTPKKSLKAEDALLTVKKISVKYSLFAFIRGDLEHAVKAVSVNGLKLNWTDSNTPEFQKKLAELIQASKKDETQKSEGAASLPEIKLPFPVNLKNCDFQFSSGSLPAPFNDGISSGVHLSSVKIKPMDDAFSVETKGSFFVAENSASKDGQTADTQGKAPAKTEADRYGNASFSLQSVITPDLNASIGRFFIKTAGGDVFSLRNTGFQIELDEDKVSLQVIARNQPFSLTADCDYPPTKVNVSLSADSFKPFSFVNLNAKTEMLKNLSSLELSGNYGFSYDIASNTAAYTADGKTTVSGIEALGSPLVADVKCSGSFDSVRFDRLSLKSPKTDLEYSGLINIADMYLQGEFSVADFLLPSGKRMSGEFYFEPQDDAMFCFAPQLFFGDTFLTALQMTCAVNDSAADFSFEAYDYSHYEVDIPGRIAAEGSLLFENGFFAQTGVSLENVYCDTIGKLIFAFIPAEEGQENKLEESLYSFLGDYVFSTELYATTDTKSVSYNVPYAVVANTKKDNEMMLVSLDGNETTVSVSRFEVLAYGQQFQASFSADSDKNYSDIFFSSSLSFNSIPYSLSGVFQAGKYLTVSGDYNTEFQLSFSKKGGFYGSFMMDSLPVAFNDYLLAFSADTSFLFNDSKDWNVSMKKIELSENSGNFRLLPRLALSGSVDRFGLLFDSIEYGDSVSVLTGEGSASWVFLDDILDSLSLELSMKNAYTEESLLCQFSGSNPLNLAYSDEGFLENFYVSGQADINYFPASRLLLQQAAENTLSASVSILGPLDNPFVSMIIPHSSFKIDGKPLDISAEFSLEDKQLLFKTLDASYDVITVSETSGSFSLDNYSGLADFVLAMDAMPLMKAESKMSLSVNAGGLFTKGEKPLSVDLVFDELTSTCMDPIKNYQIHVENSSGVTTFSAGTKKSINGYFLDSGELYVSALAEFPFLFTIYGNVKDNQMDIKVDDITADISKLSGLFAFDFFSMDTGKVSGSLHLGGLATDPEFLGTLNFTNFSFSLPGLVDEPLFSKNVSVNAFQNRFEIENSVFNCGKNNLEASLALVFDRWVFSYIDLKVKSSENSVLPVNATLPVADFASNVVFDIAAHVTEDSLSLTGNVEAEKAVAVIKGVTSQAESNQDMSVFADLTLTLGSKSQIYYPDKSSPIIRGLVSSETPVHVLVDTSANTFSLSGALVLKGGEILYLNRNFYLREGYISLNEDETHFDPKISLKAEIRERDSVGELIKITLSANDQYLSSFSPTLTSNPTKTPEEIRNLLGAAIFAENGTSAGLALGHLAVSGLDFIIQNSLFREMENQLRDLCNFDIFSFRTPFFQQALLHALNIGTGDINIGNYFDNTTVYIGKYIGTTLYMDAMLRFVYTDTGSDQHYTGASLPPGLSLQPEIGLELPAPFATMRFSIAPDISESVQNLWVPYTSISLSWKFSF